MTYNDVRKNENKGFSLVELIVVVAIMAVLVAVLAPSLLAYVERSRAQKDDSAMGEVTNAIMLALADQNVYDEVLRYTISSNYSSYVDANGAAFANLQKTKTHMENSAEVVDQWMYNDGARLVDETPWKLDGKMRGVTITFYPETSTNKSTFTLKEGKINWKKEAVQTINKETIASTKLGDMTSVTGGENYLYNRVRATVGDKIELTSQTYRNSPYTVFIRMGTTGGAQADKQDAIKVYGQWGGTNLKLNQIFDSATSTLKVEGIASPAVPAAPSAG